MASLTRAHGNVVRHAALGVDATGARAGIDTFVTNAALITRTVVVQNAFRSTRAIRVADIVGRTRARHGQALLFAIGIRATRMKVTRPLFRSCDIRFHYKIGRKLIGVFSKNRQSLIEFQSRGSVILNIQH